MDRLRGGHWQRAEDELADEVPVALEYNGISHAVMLATPADLEAFALGFSLSEGIIGAAADCYGIEIAPRENGIAVQLRIGNEAFLRLKQRRRNLAGRTGCGLCGAESLDQVLRAPPPLAPGRALSASAIRGALTGLSARQPLNRLTGGVHAAAWCAPDGELLAVFEDVGRHNALDKLIGAMARAGRDFRDGFVLMSSRASVELVQKSATVGITALVAISAPTALAVRTAQACGMTLVAFARGDDFVAYAHGEHIQLDQGPKRA
ncbi:MAG: formate dehydrogenase accessory sulfurtransferase FdhD [Pseudomonadota bacterium]